MDEFKPLIDQIYRERVSRARARTPGERMSDAFELSSIFFNSDDPELLRRLRIVRTLDERGCYGPPQLRP